MSRKKKSAQSESEQKKVSAPVITEKEENAKPAEQRFAVPLQKVLNKLKTLPYQKAWKKIKSFLHQKIWNKVKVLPYQKTWEKIKALPYRNTAAKITKIVKGFDWKKVKIKDASRKIYARGKEFCAKIDLSAFKKKAGSLSRWLSDFWKMVIACLAVFFFCYYFIGSQIAENIDVQTEYKVQDAEDSSFETADCMAFLIKREVDDKMWTPNVPPIFPAYVLDNMPNFQMGVIAAIRDVAAVLRKFAHETKVQQKDIQKAYKMLSYPPKVWLMSRQSAFLLAPSSNSQYRKAARELRK